MKLVYKSEAAKRLKKIGKSEKTKAKKKILNLLTDPLQGKLLEGKFKGLRSVKAWPLRIIYTFNSDTQTIKIETIDYRGDIYKN